MTMMTKMMMTVVAKWVCCVQKRDAEEYEQKYSEASILLQDAITRLMDRVSLWSDEWHSLSDGEKSSFCPPSPPAQTVDPSPVELKTSKPTAESREFAETSIAGAQQQQTPSVNDIPRTSSDSSRGNSDTAKSRFEVQRDGDNKNDAEAEAASKNKKWTCYTVFVKEGLTDMHLTKVRAGYELYK